MDGTAYSAVLLVGPVIFSAPSIIAPSTPGPFTVVRPFTFDATLRGIADYNLPTERTVFDFGSWSVSNSPVTGSHTFTSPGRFHIPAAVASS